MKGYGRMAIVLGLWVLATALIGFSHTVVLWSNLIAGGVVAVASLSTARIALWQQWVTGTLGLWLVVAAFIYELHSGAGLLWNNLLVGSAIATVGLAGPSGSARDGR